MKHWSKQETEEIYEQLRTKSVSEIASHFHVPYAIMIDKIHKMGLNSKDERGISWSEQEDDVIKKHYQLAPQDYTMSLLPKRSWSAITQRARKTFGISRSSKDHVYVDYLFFNEWTEKSAYVFGFILADGYVRTENDSSKNGNKNILQIQVRIDDIDIIYKIAAALKFRGQLVNYGKSIKININNANIVSQLIQKGIPATQKTLKADYPPSLPKELDRHLIRGLIDGDGWSSIGKNVRDKDRYMLGFCGTEQLVKAVRSKLPIDTTAGQPYHDAPKCWRFGLYDLNALEVAKWIYTDAHIYIDRKYETYKRAIEIYKSKTLHS